MPDEPTVHGVTRRRFLGGAAAAGASLALLPASLRRALAAAPPQPLQTLSQIQHVIFLMQENRSFDHYFGTLPGVRGFDDPQALTLSTGRSVFYQPDPQNPDGYLLPFRNDTTTTNQAKTYGTNHSWGPQHQCWNNGRMDSWVPTHLAVDGAHGPWTMGYYTRGDLPYHYALADAFTVLDNYHCSVFGPTHPNRVLAFSGTIDPDGKAGGPVVDNSVPASRYSWTTYAERLQAAGVSWKYCTAYPYDTDPGWFIQYYNAKPGNPLYDNAMVSYSPSMVADMIKSNRLPSVTWLDAQYLPSIYGLPEGAEGPGNFSAAGAQYIDTVLDALGSTPEVWAQTVFVINYDENDGRFDHVPPPTAPAGTPGEWVTVSPLPAGASGIAGPVGLGFRVPALVISPFTAGGWVCSEVFDHTSTLRFLERRFGVMEPNISAWRRQTVGDLTSALRLGEHQTAMPPRPDPVALLALQEQEAATLPDQTAPGAVQVVPHQEPGTRPHTP